MISRVQDDRERLANGRRIPMQGETRSRDWRASFLGPPRSWPPSLKSAVGLCLSLRMPAAILWGDDSLLLFNDAYRNRFAPGESVFGRPARDLWKHHWSELGPIVASVRRTGASIWLDGPARGACERPNLLGCVSFVALRDEASEARGVFCNWSQGAPAQVPIGDFVIDALAHELRDPLGSIVNLVESLRGDAPRSEALGAIDELVGHMTDLVQDLSDDSCRGLDSLSLAPVEVGEVIRAAVAAAYGQLVASRCSVSVAIPDLPVRFVADRRRLARALANLLCAIARLTPPLRDIEVFVRQAGDQVEIGVRESQLDASQLRALTCDDAAPSAAGALGVGIWLAKRIVLAHGGSFQIASDGAGRGATISMHLPGGPGIRPIDRVLESRSPAGTSATPRP